MPTARTQKAGSMERSRPVDCGGGPPRRACPRRRRRRRPAACSFRAVERARRCAEGGVHNVVDRRQARRLEGHGVGHGDVRAGDALDGCVEVVKGLRLHDDGAELRGDAALRPALLDGDEAVRLLDRADDGVAVDGPQRAEVDHLGADAHCFELLRRLEAHADHLGKGDKGDVGTLALDLGLADGQHKVVFLRLVREREGDAVEELVFEEDDGVGVADGGLEQALCVLGVPRRHDLEARHLGKPRCEALRVLGADARRGAVGAAEDDGAAEVAVGHVRLLRGRVDDLVHGLHGEVERHELAHGPQVLVRRPRRDAGEARLGDGRVEDAPVAVLLKQALCHLVRALVLRHLLAEDEDRVVARHLLVHGHVQRLADRHLDRREPGAAGGRRRAPRRASRRATSSTSSLVAARARRRTPNWTTL
mmetsp:Transcript_14404/g.51208  ORF Transcript_14404/g.51208 Transcript_14404/m.51208 type:complete len:421 (+) Transcript_14404:49-1311(+)